MIRWQKPVRNQCRGVCRHAFTLIEMVVMISIFTAASISSLTILKHLATISKKTTSHCLVIREVYRLAEQLREESHRCEVATVECNGGKLKLAFQDGSRGEFELADEGVFYRLFPATSDDGSTIKSTTVIERFAIERHPDQQFTLREDKKTLSLLLRPAIGARAKWQVDAAIAIDRQEVVTRDED